eukprot:14971301-Ditylum_brightwellii.AAC.1
MTQKDLLLCGMHATGDTLSCLGLFALMSPYCTTFANPFVIFSSVSLCSAVIASIERTDLCGPCSMAASMWSRDQSFLQFTGQPSRAYLASSGAAGCSTAYVRSHMSP